MEAMRVQLKGWKAAVAVVVVLGFVVYRYFAMRAALPEELTRELKFWLQGEYASAAMQDLEGIDWRSVPAGSVDPRVQRVLETSQVEIISMAARGDNPVVVRVEIRVAGKEPPDGEPVRYYEVRHRAGTGWKVKRRVSAFSYYLKLF